MVDFDNDQATSVLAPFSGPVSRLLVSPGDTGQKGAAAGGGGLARLRGGRRRLSQGAHHRADRPRSSPTWTRTCSQHQGVSQREEATGADRRRQRRGRPRRRAAGAGLAQRRSADHQGASQQGRPVARIEGMIRSPIAGTVAEKLITPGQLLQAGTTPCFTVADLSRVWVMAQIFDADLASVSVGDTGRDRHRHRLRHASPARSTTSPPLVNPDTRSVMARVVVDNPGDLLKKQMYVRVLIQSRQESTGMLVPVSAILRDDENLPFVYVAQPRRQFRAPACDARLSHRRPIRHPRRASRPATGSSSTAASSFSSCRANERRSAARRSPPRNGRRS